MQKSFRHLAYLFLVLAAAFSGCQPTLGARDLGFMPPHPDLREKIAVGEVALPEYMTNPDLAAQEGIDTPKGPAVGYAGALRALAVVVDFSDKVHTVTAAYFDTLIFGAPVAGIGSVRDYYSEVTYGQVDIVTVNLPSNLGWKRAPSTYATYVNNGYCVGSYPNNCQKLAEDIVDAINSVVDFSQYDNNGDGFTEPVMLIHAGPGAEYTGNTKDVWSHSWGLRNPRTYDGKTIVDYVIMPEFWSTVSAANSDMTIGVFVHEMGHGFWNLPDLYDRDYSSNGAGDWTLMAGGSWNGALGNSPAWPDAWSRVQMGYTSATVVASNASGVSIPQAYNNPAPSATIYKLQSTPLGAQEYYLVENRQKVSGSYDNGLPGSGLLVWHIDETMNTYALQNDMECKLTPNWQCDDANHYLAAVVQADGLLELENALDSGDTGDPFPGSVNKRAFNLASNPESSSYYGSAGSDSCIGVSNISNAGATMSADFKVSCSAAPSDLSAAASSQSQINLSWTDNNSDETGFKIERSPDGSTGWTEIATPAANVTTYANTGLTCNTPYYYRVRAATPAGDTGYTNTANATTQACPSALPSAPSNLAGSPASRTSITLTWTDNSNNETGFKVERSLNPTTGFVKIANPAANATSYTSTGLVCGTTYYFRVRAYNAVGNSVYSNTASPATQACGTPPTAPSNLAASAISQAQINLTWTDNSLDELNFLVERSANGSTGWSQIASVKKNITSYSNTGLACGTRYYYRVRAYGANGNSTFSNTADATTSVCGNPPAAPSTLAVVTASDTQINLSWTDNSSDEEGFRIERSPNGGSTWTEIGTVGPNVNMYANIALTCNTPYSYRVRAYSPSGNSAYSNIASATTQACPSLPAAPSGLAAVTISKNRIDLSWTDNSSNETGFKVDRSTDGNSWNKIANTGMNVNIFSNTLAMTCNTTYYYRVRAYNTAGNSGYSNVVTATTSPCTNAPDAAWSGFWQVLWFKP